MQRAALYRYTVSNRGLIYVRCVFAAWSMFKFWPLSSSFLIIYMMTAKNSPSQPNFWLLGTSVVTLLILAKQISYHRAAILPSAGGRIRAVANKPSYGIICATFHVGGTTGTPPRNSGAGLSPARSCLSHVRAHFFHEASCYLARSQGFFSVTLSY